MEELRTETLARCKDLIKRLPINDQKHHLATVVPSLLWHDRDFVLSLFDINEHRRYARANVLKLVSNDLKADAEFMIALVQKRNKFVLRYASKSLLNDPEFILRAIHFDYSAIVYAKNDWRANREFGLAAVKQNGLTLPYLAESFRGDKEIVSAAVTQNGRCIDYVTKSMRGNKDIALAAVKQNGHSLLYLDESFQEDVEIALAAVTQNGRSIRCLKQSLRRNLAIVLAAVTQCGWSLQYVDESLRANTDVALAAVTQCGLSLQYVDVSLRADPNTALAAVTQHGMSLQYVDESLRSNREIALAAINQDRSAATWVGDTLARNDHDVFVHVVHVRPRELWNASQAIQQDISMITANYSTLGQVQDYIHDMQTTRTAFMAFLGCIHTGNAQDNPCCYISEKELGDETSLALLQHTAEYTGFLFGDALASFRVIERTAPILEEFSARPGFPRFERPWNGLTNTFFRTRH